MFTSLDRANRDRLQHSKRLGTGNDASWREVYRNQHGGVFTKESCEETISLFAIVIYFRGENQVISVDSKPWRNIL